jgi:hypothetical protein
MIVPTNRGYMLGAAATLLDESATMNAWAERHVRQDPDIKWLLGNFVEADEPNSNGHIFPLNELIHAQGTLANKPLNMLHREHYIIGAFSGAQLVTAEGAEINDAELSLAAAETNPPHVEALAGLWHHRFPEEYFNIKKAHADGTLYFSMEAIPEAVSCPDCSHEVPYAGLASDSYCEHMNGATAPKRLHNPVFAGGAIIIPPIKPGWRRADVTAISKLIADAADDAGEIYEQVKADTPHLGPTEWELVMGQIIAIARDFPPDKRKEMGDKGTAMPDGSYPIANVSDLKNAIKAIGRTPASKRGAVKSHIKKRAKALGHPELIPPGW